MGFSLLSRSRAARRRRARGELSHMLFTYLYIVTHDVSQQPHIIAGGASTHSRTVYLFVFFHAAKRASNTRHAILRQQGEVSPPLFSR